MFMLSMSHESSLLSGSVWSFTPMSKTPVNSMAIRSSTARAFDSCSETYAVLLSFAAVMCSGSKLSGYVAVGSVFLTVSSTGTPSNPTVIGEAFLIPLLTSITVTEPSGSVVYRSSGSPSFATRRVLLSGVSTIIEGFGPAPITLSTFPFMSRNTTQPSSCGISAASDTATKDSFLSTTTEVISPIGSNPSTPSNSILLVLSRVRSSPASERSTMSKAFSAEFTTNSFSALSAYAVKTAPPSPLSESYLPASSRITSIDPG